MRWLITLPLTVLVVLFALGNRQPVTMALWPFDTVISTPLFVPVAGAGGLGFVLGSLMVWLALAPGRWQARRQAGRVAQLEARLDDRNAAGPLPARTPPAHTPPDNNGAVPGL